MKFSAIVGGAALLAVLSVGGVMAKNEFDRRAAVEAAQRAEEERVRRIEAAWQSRIDAALNFSQSVNLQNGLIRCTLENAEAAPARSSGDAATDFLLTVSEQPLIVFISHGFEIQSDDGRRSAQMMREEFAAHYDIIQAQPGGSAICLTSWYSFQGFGDHQPHLGDAVAAVRHLSQDALVADEARQRIVLIGYSQGGNFAKHAAVRAIDLAPSFTPQDMGVEPTLLRVVGLGTPHHGAPIARSGMNTGRGVVTFIGILAALGGDRQTTDNASNTLARMNAVGATRGMQQMDVGNAELRALNDQVAARIQAMEMVNLVSIDDDVVPYDYANWNVSLQQNLRGLLHRDFPRPVPGSTYAGVLELVYGADSIVQEPRN